MAKVSIEYLAGFFDGEGCVSIEKQGRKLACGLNSTQPHIRVGTNKQEEPLLFKDKFGGEVYKNGDIWIWTIQSKEKVADFIEKIKPHLRGKTEPIELMERFLDTYSDERNRVSEREARERLKIRDQLKNTNGGL